MKRLLYFVVFLLIALCGQSQTINQKGVTYRYNGKNKRTPIGGVYIKAVTANNGEVSNEKTGAFELALNNLRMGSRIGNVRVTKQGMMVFNQQAVDEWNVRKEPLCLVLCNADEFQRQKKNLIAIGERQAQKKYEKKLAELKKQNDSNQLKIDEYYNKLDSLEKEYQNALKHMDEYADVFARIDESEVDTVAQRAIEMFNRGEVEESILLLEQQNYMEKIKQASRTIEQADAMISTAEQAKSLAEQDLEKYIQGVKTQIAGYKLQNEWDKAKGLLKDLADNLNTVETIWEYAFFCDIQNINVEALDYYQLYKDKLEKDRMLDEKTKKIQRGRIHNNVGRLYWLSKKHEEAETEYLMALKSFQYNNGILLDSLRYAFTLSNIANVAKDKLMYDRAEEYYMQSYDLFKKITNIHREDSLYFEAGFANNVGDLCKRKNSFEESEKMFKKALSVYNELEKSTDTHVSERLRTEINLADLYSDTKMYPKSEKAYKTVLNTCRTLVASNPSKYEVFLCRILHNLGNLLCRASSRYEECEILYNEAIVICERLCKNNPQEYEPSLASLQIEISLIYQKTQRYDECENMLSCAVETYKRLCLVNPSQYSSGLAICYNHLGNLYRGIKRYEDAENSYMSDLKITEQLCEKNPIDYEPNIANTTANLALLYMECQRYKESENMFKKALKCYVHLVALAPSVYDDQKIAVQMSLAALYQITEDISNAETAWLSCIESLECHRNDSIKIYDEELALCYTTVASLFECQERIDEAEKSYKQGLELYERLAERHHSIYDGVLAQTKTSLANLYEVNKRYAESEAMYKSSLKIYECLAKDNPSDFESVLANTQYNLLFVYWKTERYTDCDSMCQICIKSYRSLYQIAPKKYRELLADCYWRMGVSKSRMKDDVGAIWAFQESLRLAREIINDGQETDIYWRSLWDLSITFKGQRNYEMAYQYINELVVVIKGYFDNGNDAWKTDYANCIISQSFYANLLGKFKEGEQYSLEAIKVDSTQHMAYTNLAAALLFQGKVEDAENLYRQYKAEFKDGFLDDFAEYERLNVIPEERKKDVERIKAMLKEE